MSIFTLILQILCERGLGIISWFIVFIPFITMTLITSIILFVFGISPETGTIKRNVRNVEMKNTNNNNEQQFKHKIQTN